ELRAQISEDVKEKLEALAERRYGDRSHESKTHVVEDILHWKLDSWQQDDISLGDWFWLQLAHHAPISWLREISWGKLIKGYFD
ncbi:unnamed protein product, partial [marine sediment metagenome]